MKYKVSILLLIFWKLNTMAQCQYSNSTFVSGESAHYTVFYKIGFLWFDAAFVNFNVTDTLYNGTKAYKFSSYGATKPSYDWIFKVRDHFSSVADVNTLNPLYFFRNTSEGSYKVNNKYHFNYADGVIYSHIENSKNINYSDTLPLNDCTLDVLTAIYACRTISTNAQNINDSIPLKMVIDNEFHNLQLRYMGKATTMLEDSSKYNCLKYSIKLVEGTIFAGGEELHVWITNDLARVPVRIEAKIMVGSVIAQLTNIKGNKWPLLSRVKNKTLE